MKISADAFMDNQTADAVSGVHTGRFPTFVVTPASII